MTVTISEEISIICILKAIRTTSNLNIAVVAKNEVLIFVRMEDVAGTWSIFKTSKLAVVLVT